METSEKIDGFLELIVFVERPIEGKCKREKFAYAALFYRAFSFTET